MNHRAMDTQTNGRFMIDEGGRKPDLLSDEHSTADARPHASVVGPEHSCGTLCVSMPQHLRDPDRGGMDP